MALLLNGYAKANLWKYTKRIWPKYATPIVSTAIKTVNFSAVSTGTLDFEADSTATLNFKAVSNATINWSAN
jgi:hypothetical protein